MARQIITPKNEQHWLELRTQDLTSTDIGALFGISPYTTEFEVWHRKKNKTIVDFDENERMKWGNILEAAIAQGIAEEQCWTVRPMKEYIRGTDLRVGSSFDFSIEERPLNDSCNDTEKGILEIKNVDGLVFKNQWFKDENGELEAPLHIEIQFQHQLLVSGRQYGYLGVLVGGNKLVLLKRDRNKVVINRIKEKATAFWKSIDENTPPEPNFQTDSEFIASLYGYSEPGKLIDIEGNENILEIAKEYKELGANTKTNDARRKEIKAKLLTLIGEAEKATGGLFNISSKMIGPTSYQVNKKGYRDFRITWKKVK